MRATVFLYFGIFVTVLFLVAFLALLPPPTHFGIPINPDITVKVDNFPSPSKTTKQQQTTIIKNKNKNNNHVTTQNKEEKTDPPPEFKSLKKRDTVQIEQLHTRIEDLEELLDNITQSAASLKRIISLYSGSTAQHTEKSPRSTALIDIRSGSCVPMEQIKIEEITPYLRSPVWFNNNKAGKYVEDRSYLDFLAHHYIPTTAPRKIYIDLGAATFESSVGWFREHYPLEFDEVHAFESEPGRFRLPPRYEIGNRFYDSIRFYETKVGTVDDKAKKTLNFARWMREELRPSENDFIVLKMDIEDGEWDMLAALEAGGQYKLVDELFVEIHYKDPDLSAFGWDDFRHTKAEAIALLRHWRSLGVYAHYWP